MIYHTNVPFIYTNGKKKGSIYQLMKKALR